MFGTKKSNLIHSTVTCDICKKNPISGVRFICLNCRDFDACEGCFVYNRTIHDQAHHFIACQKPRPGSAIENPCALIPVNSLSTSHTNITCSVCQVKSFQGLRLKCVGCPDFDLCSNCAKKGVDAAVHNPEHPMLIIPTPTSVVLGTPDQMILSGFLPSALSAKSARNRSPVTAVSRPDSRSNSNSTPATRESKLLAVGDAVVLVENYADFGDADGGPLSPGLVGVVVYIRNESPRFIVADINSRQYIYSGQAIRLAARPGEIVNQENVTPCLHVVRGPDWMSGDEYGRWSAPGVLLEPNLKGNWMVAWPDGNVTEHSIGCDGKFELAYASPILGNVHAINYQIYPGCYVMLKRGFENQVMSPPETQLFNKVGYVKSCDAGRALVFWTNQLSIHIPISYLSCAPRSGDAVTGMNVREGFYIQPSRFFRGDRSLVDTSGIGVINSTYEYGAGFCTVQWGKCGLHSQTRHAIGHGNIHELIYADPPFRCDFIPEVESLYPVGEHVLPKKLVKFRGDVESMYPYRSIYFVKAVDASKKSYLLVHGDKEEWFSKSSFLSLPKTRITKANAVGGARVYCEPGCPDISDNFGCGITGKLKTVYPDHTADVEWKNGTVMRHSIGKEGLYELFLYPKIQDLPLHFEFLYRRQVKEGSRVKLTQEYLKKQESLKSPLRPGDIGTVVVEYPQAKYLVKTSNGKEYIYGKDDIELATPIPTPDTMFDAGERGPADRNLLVPGTIVKLSRDYATKGDASRGILQVNDKGIIISDDGTSKPLLVSNREKETWWYMRDAVESDSRSGHTSSSSPSGNPLGNPSGDQGSAEGIYGNTTAVIPKGVVIGSKVVLVPNYESMEDASNGPLKPGEVGEVVDIDDSSKPVRVRHSDGRKWWYCSEALAPFST